MSDSPPPPDPLAMTATQRLHAFLAVSFGSLFLLSFALGRFYLPRAMGLDEVLALLAIMFLVAIFRAYLDSIFFGGPGSGKEFAEIAKIAADAGVSVIHKGMSFGTTETPADPPEPPKS